MSPSCSCKRRKKHDNVSLKASNANLIFFPPKYTRHSLHFSLFHEIYTHARYTAATYLDGGECPGQNRAFPFEKEFAVGNIPQGLHQCLAHGLFLRILNVHRCVRFHHDAPRHGRLHERGNGRDLLAPTGGQGRQSVDDRFVVPGRLTAFHRGSTHAGQIGIVVPRATALFERKEELEGVLQMGRTTGLDQRLGVLQSFVRFFREIDLFFELTTRGGARLSLGCHDCLSAKLYSGLKLMAAE